MLLQSEEQTEGASPAQERIVLATDTFGTTGETNGVVKTLRKTVEGLEQRGHEVLVIHQALFRTIGNRVYPELRIAVPSYARVRDLIQAFQATRIHIATEGPVGFTTRIYCGRRKLPFTSSFHTRWDQYLRELVWIPESLTWQGLRWFHNASARVLAPSRSIIETLRQKRIENVVQWKRGIDLSLFRPREKVHTVARPVSLFVGRISKEKNITDFIDLEMPGTKYVVGDGPMLSTYRAQYNDEVECGQIVFWGSKFGDELAELFSEADVFVFPSRTDTFGNVILEALASGVPVAAYPAPGPRDILVGDSVGCISRELATAVLDCLV